MKLKKNLIECVEREICIQNKWYRNIDFKSAAAVQH